MMVRRSICILLICLQNLLANGHRCNLKKYPDGFVCVCDEQYCDTYEHIHPPKKGFYVLTTTSEAGLRFHTKKGFLNTCGPTNIIVQDYQENLSESNSTSSDDNVTEITLNEGQRYQKIIGFGGAFTGAVSYILENLSHSLRKHIYKSYYSATKGIGYNMMRVIIGGCDFDLKPWTYAEEPAYDTSLSGFTKLNKEDLTKIKQYRELERVTKNYNIKKVAAAWSSPRWMKTNNAWNGKNSLLPQYYEAWANYYLRWLELMADHNMSMWGLSTGNEPSNNLIAYKMLTFLGLGFSSYDQGVFLGENLGPLLRSSIFNDVKIIGLDNERNNLPWWIERMNVGYHNATNYLDGIGVHWYYDYLSSPDILSQTHEKFPDKFILYTESCVIQSPILGDWPSAESYFGDMTLNFRHENQGWIDWNLILNVQGGPNYANNYVSAAIIVNTTSGAEFYKQPAFYALGHFSRFLIPDSVHIGSSCANKQIYIVAFKRPDKCICVIFYNQSNNRSEISINDKSGVKFILIVPPKSMNSLMYQI